MRTFEHSAYHYLGNPSEQACDGLVWLLNTRRYDISELDILARLTSEAAHARLRCFAWLAIKTCNYQSETLAAMLGLAPEEYLSLIKSDHIQARFPIAGSNGDSTMAEVFLFPFASTSPKVIALKPDACDDAQLLARMTGRSFLIAFTHDFSGSSWMCSALAGLMSKALARLKTLAFTGEVFPDGTIVSGGFLEQKHRAACVSGLNLISSLNNVKELDFWTNSKEIPVPVVQCSGDRTKALLWIAEMEKAIRREFPLFSVEVMLQAGGLELDDLLMFYEGEIPFDAVAWMSFLDTRVRNFFNRLERSLSAYKAVFWYAGMISSIQFGIGAVFGFKRPVCVCHWDPSSQSYQPVIKLSGDTDTRYLKNVQGSPDEFRFISWQELNIEREQENLSLIMYLGSHNPTAAALRHSSMAYRAKAAIVISLKNSQGHISLDDDWLELAREINTLVNHLKQTFYWKRLLVYQTTPAPICMALGIAFGHFMSAVIHHYQPGRETDYLAVYDLKDLSSN